MMFRIATWNLERPKMNGWKRNPTIISKLKEINADLWILTETNAAISPGEKFFSASTLPLAKHHDLGESTAAVWTTWPMLRNIETYDANTAVCVEVESPLGPMIVYGTIITYANDKGTSGKSKRWQEHRKEIAKQAKDWIEIRNQHPDHFFVIGGDFNQSRDGSGWYEDSSAVTDLSNALTTASLKCVTQKNFQKTLGLSRSTIDHICLPISFPDDCANADAWEGIVDGQKLSDHNGILVDIAVDTSTR